LKIGFYLAGQHLPYRPHTDADGDMRIESHSGLPLELEIWTRTGTPLRFPIADLTSRNSIIIPDDPARKSIAFRGEDGARIPGIQVVGAGFPECIFAKHDGSVDVPILAGRFYAAQASGYFPIYFDPNTVSEVTLPRIVNDVSFLDAPEGTRFLYVQSQASFDSPFALERWAGRADDGKWQAGALPAGRATITAYDTDGQVISEYPLRLSAERKNYSLAE
jgi:hypothetical protein